MVTCLIKLHGEHDGLSSMALSRIASFPITQSWRVIQYIQLYAWTLKRGNSTGTGSQNAKVSWRVGWDIPGGSLQRFTQKAKAFGVGKEIGPGGKI